MTINKRVSGKSRYEQHTLDGIIELVLHDVSELLGETENPKTLCARLFKGGRELSKSDIVEAQVELDHVRCHAKEAKAELEKLLKHKQDTP